MNKFLTGAIFLLLLYPLSSPAEKSLLYQAGMIPFVPTQKLSSSELFDKGIEQYQLKTKESTKKAEQYMLQSAQMGNAKAALVLYSLYIKGGQKTKAHNWLHKSAELGNIWSAHSLGHKYQTGHGVKKNLKKSCQYFKQASLGEMSEAKRDLALCFYFGKGVEKNEEQALRWMQKAAHENVSLAQYKLGIWFKNGIIVEKNTKKAQYWFSRAIKLFKLEAAKGNQQSAFNYAYMNDNGYGVKENNPVAYEAYLELAIKNNHNAQFWLAIMYLNGDGIKKNIPEGKKWMLSSYQLGNTSAKSILKKNGWLED